jgi:NADPH:quinone reductase-like Zn-dependent oxidoreductase
MKAVQFDRLGSPDVLHVVELPEPHAGAGQIRIAVHAASVNPVDWKIRNGSTLRTIPVPLPHVPGFEAAGTVDEVGDGVAGVGPGDEVFGAAQDATAEYAVLDHWARKPAAMSWEQAAGVPMAAETAARGIDLLGLEPGHVLVVSGAAGGVGVAATQLAISRGAAVIGTASEDNQDFLRSLGAKATVYGPGLVERIRGLVPAGVDRGLDVAGGGALADLVQLAGSPDRVVSIGDASAPDLGVRFTTGTEGRAFYALELAATLFDQGAFTMPVAQVWPFSQLAKAHRVSESGHVRGKLVVVPDRAGEVRAGSTR